MGSSASADALRANARILDAQGRLQAASSASQEELSRRNSAQVLGEQRAMISQSGMSSSGTAADVAEQSGANAEIDALNIRFKGAVDLWNTKEQAKSLRTQAKQAKSFAGTMSSLLGQGAQAYGNYQSMGGSSSGSGS
jgi:hypothetical protein